MSTEKVTIMGIIPARGGSKSIPNKNIAIVAGKPLLAYTIKAAIHAKPIERVIVSTDSQEIGDIALSFGAEVPFLRPSELARDVTPGIEPVLHAVRWLDEQESYCPDYVMVLQPTSPLRTAKDIEASVHLALEKEADGVVSVSPVRQHPFWMKKLTDDGQIIDFLPLNQVYYTRRQDLPSAYALNGAIYLVKRSVLLEQRTFYTHRTYAYIIPPERSLDIDSPWDLYLADLILKDGFIHGHD